MRCGLEHHLRLRVCTRCELEFYAERPAARKRRLEPPLGRPPQRQCTVCGMTSHIRCHHCKQCGLPFAKKAKLGKEPPENDSNMNAPSSVDEATRWLQNLLEPDVEYTPSSDFLLYIQPEDGLVVYNYDSE